MQFIPVMQFLAALLLYFFSVTWSFRIHICMNVCMYIYIYIYILYIYIYEYIWEKTSQITSYFLGISFIIIRYY